MKGTLFAAALLAASTAALAGEKCPEVAKEQWLRAEEVQARLQAKGVEVKRVKREGSCYEVKGKDREGRKVELYVSPADASIVKEKVKS